MGAERRCIRRMARAAGAALALAALAACESPSVPVETFAYDPTELTGGQVYHWDLGHTITVFADTVAQPAGYDLAAAVRAGAAAWAPAAYYGEFQFRLVSDPHDADVIVRYRQAPGRVDDADCNPPGSGAGETIFCPDQPEASVLPLLSDGGGHVRVEVVVDPFWVQDATLAQYGLTRPQHFVRIVTHELGHVLGIGAHSPDITDIMHALAVAPGPSAADASALRWVLRQHADIRL